MTRKKRFEVKAWIGVVDGDLSWSAPMTSYGLRPQLGPKNLCELFRTRNAAKEIYEDVRRVTLVIHRGLEGPKSHN